MAIMGLNNASLKLFRNLCICVSICRLRYEQKKLAF